jgi:hypothetical protein
VYGGDTLALIAGGDDAAADMQAILEAQEDIFMFMGLLTEPDNWDRLLREVVGEPRFVQETEVVKEAEVAKEAEVTKKAEVVKEAEVAEDVEAVSEVEVVKEVEVSETRAYGVEVH